MNRELFVLALILSTARQAPATSVSDLSDYPEDRVIGMAFVGIRDQLVSEGTSATRLACIDQLADHPTAMIELVQGYRDAVENHPVYNVEDIVVEFFCVQIPYAIKWSTQFASQFLILTYYKLATLTISSVRLRRWLRRPSSFRLYCRIGLRRAGTA